MMPWFLLFSEKKREEEKMPLSESNHFHADNFTAE